MMITLTTTKRGGLLPKLDEWSHMRLDRAGEANKLSERTFRVEQAAEWDSAIDRWVNEGGATVTRERAR
jgi:hypothetical protein